MRNADKVNILMVDDQPSKLLSYEVILRELGENLIQATSGKEALEHLLRQEIAVVLMDVSMPDIDGFELAEMIRQHPRFQKTAIIFISGVHLSDVDRIKGYQRGAVDYISVPVVPELLRAKVSVFAELHRKTRQLERLNQELEFRVAERSEELRERAELLELASEAIVVRDLEGAVKFWNSGAEALYGWSREEILGRKLHDVLKTRFPAPFLEIQAALATTGTWSGNLVQTTRWGGEIVVACRKSMSPQRQAVLEINRDITAQLRAEEALRRSEKLAAMGRVAGIVAHEINNPLEAITNTFYLLRDHPSLNDEARTLARMGEQELARVCHITRQTLSFYRESQHPMPVSITDLLDDVLDLQSRSLELNAIQLEKHYRSDAKVEGFPVELKQVFLNLIANAVQAMPTGGRLRVKVCASRANGRPPGALVSITDNGVGIPPHLVKHLFEPFFTTKSTKGTGLGLWISKGIIQKYEGSLRCRSVAVSGGKATCFSVFIPGAAEPTSARRKMTPLPEVPELATVARRSVGSA
ncbi:MAG: response regulator [Acidobacteria bacterium]|nr:response regulator [Acidobacteriota bacterium]